MPSKKPKSKRPVVRRTSPPSCSGFLLVGKVHGRQLLGTGVFSSRKAAEKMKRWFNSRVDGEALKIISNPTGQATVQTEA